MKMSGDAEEWEDFPLFAPSGVQIPELSNDQTAEELTSAVGALSHLLYDEETPLEQSELLRDEGNRHFKRGKKGYRKAIKKYSDAISAAGDVKEAVGPALLNRAMAEFNLGNYGRALQDVEHSLQIDPGNVKAHYRAVLCALELEKNNIALQHYEEGLRLAQGDESAAGRRNVALFKRERIVIDKALDKAQKYEHERTKRQEVAKQKQDTFETMLKARGVTMGLPLFGQQRRYSSHQPIERDGLWYWPLLLVYPEDAIRPGAGDQSDFLEEVAENATVHDILASVFSDDLPLPEWDVNRAYQHPENLDARYRTQWTMELTDADSDDEQTFCGSSLPADEVGHWINVDKYTKLSELLARKNYITPVFPVLYIVPRHIELP